MSEDNLRKLADAMKEIGWDLQAIERNFRELARHLQELEKIENLQTEKNNVDNSRS